jgi:hypothetical protein
MFEKLLLAQKLLPRAYNDGPYAHPSLTAKMPSFVGVRKFLRGVTRRRRDEQARCAQHAKRIITNSL